MTMLLPNPSASRNKRLARPSLRGRKPKNMKPSPTNPEAHRAVTREEGPGIGVTGRPRLTNS